MLNNASIGKLGEQAAADFLRQAGYRIVEFNFQNTGGRRLGEIDIIAEDRHKGQLVFVEVKTRAGEKYFDTLPEENITPAKLRRLSRIANTYLSARDLQTADYRFDAVSVWLDQDGHVCRFKHIEAL